MAIRKVGVLGCGLMGSGIAQVTAAAGVGVAFRQVASPWVGASLLTKVFAVSEVAHEPIWSGINGQFPIPVEVAENCT
jgi:3-hydroxyacyl-CoA dehydrogenase